MKEKLITDISENDILAVELVTDTGVVVLPLGAKLSSSMPARLKKMGFSSVMVEDNSEESDEKKRQLTSLLDERFKGSEDDPFMCEMKEIVGDHIKNL